MKSKPNIRDVARIAGVSTKTVSRVTNDEGTVAAQTRQRVLAAIAELGYSANPMARSLRTGSDEAIALVVTTIADPFFASVVDAVERAAREQGLFLLVACSGDDPANERTVIAGMLNRSVSGLLIVPQNLDYGQADLPLGPGGAPVVFLDRPPRGMHGDTVMIDNAAVAEAATRHLIGYGHERIAFVGVGSEDYTVSARLSGYRYALEQNGILYDESLVRTYPEHVGMDDVVFVDMLEREDPPTAVLGANSVASLGLIGELHRTGHINIAVVSFDDFSMAESLTPAITVARQDPVLMGRRGFELLDELMHGERRQPREVILPTTFIERGSGELRPRRTSMTKNRGRAHV